MAYLSPFSLLDVDFNQLLACFAPQVFVRDDLRPPYVEDVARHHFTNVWCLFLFVLVMCQVSEP